MARSERAAASPDLGPVLHLLGGEADLLGISGSGILGAVNSYVHTSRHFFLLYHSTETWGCTPTLHKEPQQIMLKSCQGLKYVYKFSFLNRWPQEILRLESSPVLEVGWVGLFPLGPLNYAVLSVDRPGVNTVFDAPQSGSPGP